MEQITRIDGVLYYGSVRCKTIDEVYLHFREDYHRSIGRDSNRRLNRLGQRTELVHGFGFHFTDEPDYTYLTHRVDCWLLGMLDICYTRSIGIWSYREVPDEEFDTWLDTVLSAKVKHLRMRGFRDKVGRTSKHLKKRFK